MSIESFREWVNLRIFKSKSMVMNVFDVLSIVVALLGVTLIVYIFGFQQSLENHLVQLLMLKIVFAYYMLNYFVRFLYTFEPGNFFQANPFRMDLAFTIGN
nr:hypothetical protein [Bacteroidota bacterium]